MSGPLLSVEEAVRVLGGDALVLDASVDLARPQADGDHRAVSGHDGWLAARIPGSWHLDLLTEFTDSGAGFHFAQPSPARAHQVLSGLGVHDGREVVLYDRHDGLWAARAWWSLRALGVPARVLDGGLAAWRAAGGSLEKGLPRQDGPAAIARPLTLRPDPSRWFDRHDVLAVVEGRRSGTLVCALGPDQFTGTATTRYSRRGHIPGSTNLPARSLTGPAGTVLPAADLHAAFAALPGTGPLVLYCGGGISASYLALALVAAGRTDVVLYDGSLEEWSADPTLPLEV